MNNTILKPSLPSGLAICTWHSFLSQDIWRTDEVFSALNRRSNGQRAFRALFLPTPSSSMHHFKVKSQNTWLLLDPALVNPEWAMWFQLSWYIAYKNSTNDSLYPSSLQCGFGATHIKRWNHIAPWSWLDLITCITNRMKWKKPCDGCQPKSQKLLCSSALSPSLPSSLWHHEDIPTNLLVHGTTVEQASPVSWAEPQASGVNTKTNQIPQ